MKRKSDSVVQVELNPTDHSGGTTDTTSSTSPLYGTHQYWENRYQQFFRNPINDQDPPDPIHQQIYCFPVTEENKNSVDDNLQKEMPEPGHAWYFTYDELQPLIMPLILGNDSILDQNDSVEETIINVTTTKDMESNTQDRTFHVLEIGCGDVPLGIDLCKDLQKNTRKGDSIPKYHVLCFDYCETVIQHLIQQHRGNACDWDDAKNSSSFIHLEFKVHDARDLPYEDQFFSLVMDKGTIDAQISDGENGFTDCITMVHEVARLLKYNGTYGLSLDTPTSCLGRTTF
jgi:ubiquinone/menaquinone biosynthesis C-methylase UbiE